MKKLRFVKEIETNDWYVDLPEWNGEHWELQMVAGADVLLDIISDHSSEVNLTISLTPVNGFHTLTLISLDSDKSKVGLTDGGGATYMFETNKGTKMFDLWLCHVTKFALGSFPERIWFK